MELIDSVRAIVEVGRIVPFWIGIIPKPLNTVLKFSAVDTGSW